MTLTLNIPDPLQQRLEAACTDLPRAVLEGFAVEAYRTGTVMVIGDTSVLRYLATLGQIDRRASDCRLSCSKQAHHSISATVSLIRLHQTTLSARSSLSRHSDVFDVHSGLPARLLNRLLNPLPSR